MMPDISTDLSSMTLLIVTFFLTTISQPLNYLLGLEFMIGLSLLFICNTVETELDGGLRRLTLG